MTSSSRGYLRVQIHFDSGKVNSSLSSHSEDIIGQRLGAQELGSNRNSLE